MLLEINKKGFDLFNEIPITERLDYTISYDFHIVQGRKSRGEPSPHPYGADAGRAYLASVMHHCHVRKEYPWIHHHEERQFQVLL